MDVSDILFSFVSGSQEYKIESNMSPGLQLNTMFCPSIENHYTFLDIVLGVVIFLIYKNTYNLHKPN